MKQKTLYIIVAIILALVVLVVLVFRSQTTKKAQKVNMDSALTQSATVDRGGSVNVVDKKVGTVFVIDPQNINSKKSYTSPVLSDADSVKVSPDGSKAIATKNDFENLQFDYSLVNLKDGSLIKKAGENWYNPVWAGNDQILYSKVVSQDSVSGLYRYDIKTNVATEILPISGSLDDEFQAFGDYVIYVSTSTDASPVDVTVYDVKAKKVVKKLSQELHAQLLTQDNRAVLIGKNIIELLPSGQGITVNEYPNFLPAALYALTGNTLLALEITPDVNNLKTGKLNLIAGSKWQQLGLTVDLSSVGYIYSISASQNNLVLLTATGIYQYPY